MRLLGVGLLVLVAAFLASQVAYADWVSIPEPAIHRVGSNNIEVDFDPIVVTSVCRGPSLRGFAEIQRSGFCSSILEVIKHDGAGRCHRSRPGVRVRGVLPAHTGPSPRPSMCPRI